MGTARPALLVAVLALLVAAGFVLAGQPAEGQTPPTVCVTDPEYGCISTTTLAPGEVPTPACLVSSSSARVGESVTATITNVPAGMSINLSLAGQVVASGTSGASPSGYSDVAMTFAVPNLAEGNYSLVATGPGFSNECLPGTGFQVLSAAAARTPDGGSLARTDSGGSLARTGFTILGFLLLAALLIVGGRYLLERSRQPAD